MRTDAQRQDGVIHTGNDYMATLRYQELLVGLYRIRHRTNPDTECDQTRMPRVHMRVSIP